MRRGGSQRPSRSPTTQDARYDDVGEVETKFSYAAQHIPPGEHEVVGANRGKLAWESAGASSLLHRPR